VRSCSRAASTIRVRRREPFPAVETRAGTVPICGATVILGRRRGIPTVARG